MQIARQTAEEHAKSLESYISEGEKLAKDLGNRGPVVLTNGQARENSRPVSELGLRIRRCY